MSFTCGGRLKLSKDTGSWGKDPHYDEDVSRKSFTCGGRFKLSKDAGSLGKDPHYDDVVSRKSFTLVTIR